jgi:phosphoglycolate phosphatase-like HAD superfamily hydrolase
MDAPPLEAVVFDMDGTLIDSSGSSRPLSSPRSRSWAVRPSIGMR